MTRFIRIDPTAKTVEAVDAYEWAEAAKTLKRGHVDFAGITRDMTIIVYEWGLMEGDGPYFALGGHLYSGEAILYAANEAGDTIDMPENAVDRLAPIWMADKSQVERLIAAGHVQRPQSTVNGAVVWQWS